MSKKASPVSSSSTNKAAKSNDNMIVPVQKPKKPYEEIAAFFNGNEVRDITP